MSHRSTCAYDKLPIEEYKTCENYRDALQNKLQWSRSFEINFVPFERLKRRVN